MSGSQNARWKQTIECCENLWQFMLRVGLHDDEAWHNMTSKVPDVYWCGYTVAAGQWIKEGDCNDVIEEK